MWRLAWRNLWRNRTRTLITGSAIALGLGLLLFSYNANEDMYAKMMDAAVTSAGGSVLLHGHGYWSSQSSEKVLTDWETAAERARSVPGVSAVLPRILVNGLLTSPRGNAGIRLMGIQPDTEAAFDDRSRFLSRGTFLAPGEERPLVLGKGVVEDLKLELGDRVVITATDPSGEIVRALFRLSGIIDSGSDLLDEGAAYTRLEVAQAGFGMTGAVTQLGILVDDDERRHQRRDAVVQALGAQAPGIEALTWDEAMPELVAFIEVDRQGAEITGAIIFLIVAFGIANTFLMAVLERVRELGLLGALGVTPGRVAWLVLAESVLLATLAITAGVVIGLGSHAYLDAVGLDIAAFSGGDIELSGVILEDMVMHSKIAPARWARACLAVFGVVVLSALYPAWRATRLQPAAAMRTYE